MLKKVKKIKNEESLESSEEVRILYIVFDYIIAHKKEVNTSFILLILCILIFPYLFSWIHELWHAITAIINGVEVIRIEVYYPMGGITRFAREYLFISKESKAWICLSGSLGRVLSIGIINRIIYQLKTKFSVFLPLFIVTSFFILMEVASWIWDIENYTNGIATGGDAYQFLYNYLQINYPLILIDPHILQGTLIFFLIVILEWFAFNLIKRIREKINTIRKSIQN